MNDSANKPIILDCTLRDGGYYTNWDFDQHLVNSYLLGLNKLPIDYVELGYLSDNHQEYRGAFYYLPVPVLRNCRELSDHKLAAMIDEKNTNSEVLRDLLNSTSEFLDLIRITVKPGKIESAVKLVEVVKGFDLEVALNFMYASQWINTAEIEKVIMEHSSSIDFIYIVDSYGGLYPQDLKKLISNLKIDASVRFGFHGHNNLELALSNSLTAIEEGVDIIDTTILGMGRGAGNLKLELLLSILNEKMQISVDFDELAMLCNTFSELKEKHQWGTNLAYMVSGVRSMPQDAVISQLHKRYFSLNKYFKDLKFEDFKEANYLQTELLIIGGGNSINAHKKAIVQFINENENLSVLFASARNAFLAKEINRSSIFFFAGNDAKRLVSNGVDELNDLIGLLPPDFFKTNNFVPENFSGKVFQLNNDYSEKFGRSVTSISFQMAKKTNVKSVYLAGYDGYSGNIDEKEAELQRENQQIFDEFRDFSVTSITPTLYNVSKDSVYRLIR